MLKRKRITIAGTILLILCLILTACVNSAKPPESSSSASSPAAEPEASNDKPYEGSTVKILITAGGVGQFNAWKARAPQFTEQTGIKLEFIETPYENLLENITSDGIANAGNYDLVAYLDTMGPSISNFLEPLNDYVRRDNFDLNRWSKGLLDLSTYDGKLISLPVRGQVQMLMYRKDLFEKAQVKVPTTWAELEEAGKKIKEVTGKEGIIPYYAPGNNGQNLYMWTSYLWSNGGDIFDANFKPIFNNQQGIEATQRYVDLLLKHNIASKSSITFGEQDARTSFKNGDGAMLIVWWWAYPEFNDPNLSAPEVVGNAGFAPVPGWEGRGSSTNILSFPLGMMKGSKNKDAAWEVLKWIADPAEELAIVKATVDGTAPSDQNNTVMTQFVNLMNEELNAKMDNFFKVGAEGFQNSKALPVMKEWPKISDILSAAISEMAIGKPVEPTLSNAAKQVEALLKEAGYYQ